MKKKLVIVRGVFPEVVQSLSARFDVVHNEEDRPWVGEELAQRLEGAAGAMTTVRDRFNATRVERDELLRESDFVVVMAPYSPATHHLIGERELARMKPTAVLVNSARGGVVDDAALVEALRAKRIAAAGLDVFEGEPSVN